MTTHTQRATPDSEREQIFAAIDEFSEGMLVTIDPNGMPHARPMKLLRREGGQLWFATDADAGKLDEIHEDRHVAVTMQSSSAFLAVSGTAEVRHDPHRARALWNVALRVWFPDGPEDPRLRLIRVDARTAELWTQGAADKLAFTKAAIEALVKGEPVEPPERSHSETTL